MVDGFETTIPVLVQLILKWLGYDVAGERSPATDVLVSRCWMRREPSPWDISSLISVALSEQRFGRAAVLLPSKARGLPPDTIYCRRYFDREYASPRLT